jgi:hypothetical protein
MAYTALSVLGTFSFATVEPFYAITLKEENKTQDKLFCSSAHFFIQYPAEEPATFTTLGSTRFSPLHMGFQRNASLLGSPIGGTSFSKSSPMVCTKLAYTNLKNTILLKLRI